MSPTNDRFFSNFVLRIGRAIQQARNERGWSQQKLAEQADLRRATINDIENGKTNPTLDTLLSIAIALEVPLISLIPLPAEERARQDELPDWIREALKHMKYISNETTQQQIVAMVKAAAEVEIRQAQEEQDRDMLDKLDRKIALGEKLSPQMKKLHRELKDRYSH